MSPEQWSDTKYMKYQFAWVLSNVQRLPTAVPYDHISGCQKWVILTDEEVQNVIGQLSMS